jgi:hypothetical protein
MLTADCISNDRMELNKIDYEIRLYGDEERDKDNIIHTQFLQYS